MKTFPLKTLICTLFITLLIFSCSSHCDDEDYRREELDQASVRKDSLIVQDQN